MTAAAPGPRDGLALQHKLATWPGWSEAMTPIDRFRTQGRHKHPDPAVRLAYVEDIPLEEREVIGLMAREDEDVRVRRAAVAKSMDAAALGAIAGTDRDDEAVRGQAAAMLRDIAVEAFEGVTEADSLEAVDALTDGRALAQIAKTAGPGNRGAPCIDPRCRYPDARIHRPSRGVRSHPPRRVRAARRRRGPRFWQWR